MADKTFIAFDWCGWNESYGRFTHIPSGKTIVQPPGISQAGWDQKQLDFFSKYPGLNVHDCACGPYTDQGTRLMGSTEENRDADRCLGD